MNFTQTANPVRVGGSLLQLMVVTHSVTGKLRADTQAALDTKIATFNSVFNSSNISAVGLYFDNGTPTQHVIQTSATLDGIKLVNGPNYPSGSGAEYSVFRTVQFTLQAEVKSANRDLVQFQETISVSGGTRPSTWLLPADGSLPIRQRLVRIPYTITQAGSAETYRSTFAWPDPLGEEPDTISQTAAGAEYNRGGQATYRWSWDYQWTTLTTPAATLRPNDRRGYQ
uniref:Uncharacterized protein n=1 Tax=Rubinisphaera brasiliensis (strain ATCC 49424 / DSM 5305 / JCM 21570 / IAM 15109 / NBRC 103401 / IFAM 1448) TaxID=756272 RepID=F0SPF9_RUBBR|nr:hypothetical protein Plabr_0234 [Rubinisphaera brasiliensis DSM 5305]